MKTLIQLLLFPLIFSSYSQDEGYRIVFDKIDNRVDVLVAGKVIYTSGTIHKNPQVKYEIALSESLLNGETEVTVRLYNGVEPYNAQLDGHWEIRYDIIKDGEILDYVWEFEDVDDVGVVFEQVHNLDEL